MSDFSEAAKFLSDRPMLRRAAMRDDGFDKTWAD